MTRRSHIDLMIALMEERERAEKAEALLREYQTFHTHFKDTQEMEYLTHRWRKERKQYPELVKMSTGGGG